MAKLPKSSSKKAKTLLASRDIWKDSGILASDNMKKELKNLGITPVRLINTKSSGFGTHTNISDKD